MFPPDLGARLVVALHGGLGEVLWTLAEGKERGRSQFVNKQGHKFAQTRVGGKTLIKATQFRSTESIYIQIILDTDAEKALRARLEQEREGIKAGGKKAEQ